MKDYGDSSEENPYWTRGEAYSDITLRDLFAGLAMQGMMSNALLSVAHPDTMIYADLAYMAADAMLTERGRRDGE